MTAESGASVLVADDEPVLQRLITRVLEREGFDVEVVSDGDAAVEAVRARPGRFGALLLDLTLPPRGGEAVYRAVLALRDDLSVIVTSGSHPDPGLRELLDAHGGAFLAKPFSPEALLAAVHRAAGSG